MGHEFELIDPDELRQYLGQMPAASRHKGKTLQYAGQVVSLKAFPAERKYLATVEQTGVSHEVRLEYGISGWSSLCESDGTADCPHVCAAICEVLSQYSRARVQLLSGANRAAAEIPPMAPGRLRAPVPELGRRAALALGRPLKPAEREFALSVQASFERCRSRNRVTGDDLLKLGFPYEGKAWEVFHLWPAFPKTEHEFWLYIAHFARASQWPIPEWLEPISDTRAVAERLHAWQRDKDIQAWRARLKNFHGGPAEPGAGAESELRIRLGPESAMLEIRTPGAEEFQLVKSRLLSQLNEGSSPGGIVLTPVSELLWRAFGARQYYSNEASLSYQSASLHTLGRILNTPFLAERVVNHLGEPLRFAEAPLRWEMLPPEDATGDYRFQLKQADGQPAPTVLFVTPPPKSLYVTAQVAFPGPPGNLAACLGFSGETRVPAPALEQAEGLRFLEAAGVPVPERVQARIRVVPFRVRIACELERPWSGSNTEEVTFMVHALAEDGTELRWDGEWAEVANRKLSIPVGSDAPIIKHDRSILSEVGGSLNRLGVKPTAYGRAPALRVSRKFPEIFAEWLRGVPPEVTLELQGELASFARADVSGRARLEISEAPDDQTDWFDLRVLVDVSDTTLTAEEIRLLLNARGKFVRLKGKGWKRFLYSFTEEEDEQLARLGLSPRELSAEPQRLHTLQLADKAARKFLQEDQVQKVQRRASELKARVAPAVPPEITATLRPYQVEGYQFLAYLSANRFGGILADDMGLGKTLQTLAWILYLRAGQAAGQPPGACLVVCPKSVMDNWHAEAARFAPSLRVRVWSPRLLPLLRAELKTADLHVINYTQLRNLGESLTPVRWLAVILDEGQYIKNPSSQTAQVARTLRADHRLILSGTPIENRLLDLWSMMGFAMPGILGSRPQFAKLYDAKDDPHARRRLSARVRPFLLRRTKAQVATDLPDRIEEDLYCEIEGEQQTLYRAELKSAQQRLLRISTQKELAQQQFNFLTSLLRLRQICCHPKLVKPDSMASSAKIEALLETLEPLIEEGHKVLVFSQFVELLALVRSALEPRQWRTFWLTGETENRGEIVRDFQSAEGPAVFLISLKAGGFGLNLTAASYVVLFDPWWNPAVEAQAIDRTHRIGQVNKVIAYRLLIKDSIEEKIRELQKRKKSLAEDVLGEEKFAQSLTLEDLRFLFTEEPAGGG